MQSLPTLDLTDFQLSFLLFSVFSSSLHQQAIVNIHLRHYVIIFLHKFPFFQYFSSPFLPSFIFYPLLFYSFVCNAHIMKHPLDIIWMGIWLFFYRKCWIFCFSFPILLLFVMLLKIPLIRNLSLRSITKGWGLNLFFLFLFLKKKIFNWLLC